MASASSDSSSSLIHKQLPMDDRMHPYYLHHSDSPGMALVSQPLDGDNYASWSQAVIIALNVNNKTRFIDNTLMKPDESDSILLKLWQRNNDIVVSWMLSCMSKEISSSIMYVDTAYAIWIDLKERFQQGNEPRVFQIHREIATLAQNQEAISLYFTKLKSLWEELSHYRPPCSCGKCDCGGVKKIEKDHVMNFLMGLDETFSHTRGRGQVLLMDSLPQINKTLFSCLTRNASQVQQGSSTNSGNQSMAFNINTRTGPNR
ncbi:hypothetical protein OSB04_028146 [Centaurea solstitialis]|uniref:Retrotransposon Copia-like N-terminal domain-containing protein n=1 Tax=Centaurea solstitialis TaxID=347529 RepID=A0AA38W7G1_9ASTR|nr:hypothetical protein OSB04_028146 [Centaurea solstitialis]